MTDLTEEDVAALHSLVKPFTMTELGALLSVADDLEEVEKVLGKVSDCTLVYVFPVFKTHKYNLLLFLD